MRTIRFALLALAWLAACAPAQNDAADVTAIEALMHATWDSPEGALVVAPVVVEGDDAIADWTQGAHGGRALLRRRGES